MKAGCVYTAYELKDRRRWPRRKLLQEIETVRLELGRANRRMARFKNHVAAFGYYPQGYALTETEIKLRKADLAMLKNELNRRSRRGKVIKT